jgi:hypothetical protein
MKAMTVRKRIEEYFGWAKTIGCLRKSRFIGREKLEFPFVLTFVAYNLIRMRNLKRCRVEGLRVEGVVCLPGKILA